MLQYLKSAENTVALIQMKGLPEYTPLTFGVDLAKGTYLFDLFWNCDHVHVYTHHFHKGNSNIKEHVIYYV